MPYEAEFEDLIEFDKKEDKEKTLKPVKD